MTLSGIVQYPQTETFDERIKLCISELELAVKWDRSASMLFVYNSDYVRADAETALENFLIAQGQKVVHIELDETPDLDLISYFQEFSVTARHIFFVNGLNPSQKNNATRLEGHFNLLLEKKARIMFWLTPKALTDLAHLAPHFWEHRLHTVEFLDDPNPEHILQTAVESAWLGTGEYEDQFEDTEEKISMRETFLTELPENAESTSTRANLKLTLGILNWRKGNYEKADDLLRKAIQEAIRLEDKWFEAQCYNALALVKFSQGKNDEAIDAYKQAIEIAPEQIYVWNNLGNLCLKINRNDEAMLAFHKAIAHNPKDAVAWNGLGDVYYKIGYIDDSISAYRKAITYAPSLASPWIGLGDAYTSTGRDIDAIAAYQKSIEVNKQSVTPWLRMAGIFTRQGRNRDAIKSYQHALLVEPNNSQIWNEFGLVLLRVNSYEDAADAFSKAIDLDRAFGWAYCNLATVKSSQNKYQEAIEACQQSLNVFSDDNDKAAAWDQLANLYRSINEYDNVMYAIQMADGLKGRIAMPQPASASDSPQPESTEKAEANTEGSSSPMPTPVEDHLPTGDIQIEKQPAPAWIFQTDSWNQGDIAIPAYSGNQCWKEEVSNVFPNPDTKIMEEPSMKTQETSQFEPVSVQLVSEDQYPSGLFENGNAVTETTNPEIWNQKGNIHFQNGEYEQAITAYNKAIELSPSFGWPYNNLALTYLTLGKYAEAILLYQKSASLLQTQEEQASAWNIVGNIYRHLNDYKSALESYQKADDLDPKNAGNREKVNLELSGPNSQSSQVWLELGNLFFKSGAYGDAVNAYEQAVKLDPTSGWAHSNLAMGLALQGKYKAAVPVYLKSIDLFTDDKDKATALNRLGNVYRKLHDQDNASKAYKAAVILSKEKTTLLTRTRFTLLGNCFANQ